MAALSHINAASSVPSYNICTTEVSNERKYFLPNLQYYQSIIPVYFISEHILAFWLSWLKFSVLPMSGSTLLDAQIILADRMHTLKSSYSTCMVMTHKPSQMSISCPKVLAQFSTEFCIWGHVHCSNYDSYWGCTVVRCDVV